MKLGRLRDVLKDAPRSEAQEAHAEVARVSARAAQASERASAAVARAQRFMDDVVMAERVAAGSPIRAASR